MDLPLCCRDPGQQVRPLRQRFPLPSSPHLHPYGLLLYPGLVSPPSLSTLSTLSHPLPPSLSPLGPPLLIRIVVKLGLAEATPITADTYIRCILPIGLLFAGTLWTSNAAYLYLSVSFIQMLKASMPLVVFIVGCFFGTEKFTLGSLGNMVRLERYPLILPLNSSPP